ncbi:MAG TPA: aminotransferase class IV [Stellaceae bacterium]|nr:aminotransferase class IV [Stellaceae bacterium]
MSETRANHRVAYFNGKIVPEREVVIPFRDRGFKYGDAAFDMTRTFNGVPFKLKEHIARLYRSLRYLRIDPGLGQGEMIAINEEVLDRNRHFLTPDTDYWVGQRVSRGVDAVGDEGWDHPGGPTVIVECIPLPLKARARLFRDGIDIVVPPTRRVPPDMLSPRAKTHNYLNLIMADLEAKAQDKEAWSVLLDAEGHLAEGIGSNFFIVRDGEVLTPRERSVLPGISRETVIELCGQLGIPCREADLDLYDAATADEIFMSSTSLCLCPVRSIGGRQVPAPIPGPITARLTKAYAESVGCDFVAQYLKHLA